MIKKIINKHFGATVFVLISIIAFEIGFVSTLFVTPAQFISNFQNFRVGKGSIPRAFIVQSGSMEPKIRTGSLVFTIPQKNYRVGEVITFSPTGSHKNLVTHRISSVTGEGEFTTKGDANEDADSQTIQTDKIVGRTIFSIPYLGFLANFAKNPKGFILLVIVPATIVIYEELKNLKKELSKLFSRLRSGIIKKNREVNTAQNYDYIFPTPLSQKTKNVPLYAVAVPVLGVLLILVAFSASYFSDHEKSVNNVLGAAENFESSSTTSDFTPTPTTGPQLPVINEFLPDSASEFVEFYNPHNSAEYLKSYYLDDDETFGDGAGQGSSMILLTALVTTDPHYPYIEISSFLNNTGDKVVLFDNTGSIVDSYSYPPPDALDEISIGRIPDKTGIFVNLTTLSKGLPNIP